MQFDYKTILFFFTGNILVITVIFIVYAIITNSNHWNLKLYIVSKILLLLSILGIALRGVIPDVLSIEFSNILLLSCFSIEALSIISYDRLFHKKLFIYLLVLTISSYVTYIVFSDNNAARSAITAFQPALAYSISAVSLIRHRKKLKFPVFLGVIFIIFSCFQFIRGTYILVNLDKYEFFNISLVDNLFFVFALIQIVMVSVGYLILLKENDDAIIRSNNAHLTGLIEEKNQLHKIIAHDLRGPIGAINGISKVAFEQFDELNKQDKKMYLSGIYQTSIGLSNLLENLLQWSLTESGELSIKPETIDLHELFEEIIDLLKSSLEEKNIKYNLELKERQVFCDKNMINTVVRNILSNAIKFSESGSSILITSSEESAGTVSLDFIDNGIGISPEVLEKIISNETNYSSYSTKGTKNEPGTGIGLKLSKKLINMNNGRIAIESKSGSGTTIRLYLPKNIYQTNN